MTLKELKTKLNNIDESLEDKEVYVIAQNGMLLEPYIKYRTTKDIPLTLNDNENKIESIIITWD